MNKAYKVITERFIAMIERGIVPWQSGYALGRAQNLVTGHEYTGVNYWMTKAAGFTSPYWLTFNQTSNLGGMVKAGSKGFPIVYWGTHEKEDAATGGKEHVWYVRYYTIFNVGQVVLPDDVVIPTPEEKPVTALETIALHFVGREGITVRHGKPSYNSLWDRITMPTREEFASSDNYGATFLHECAHATGHSSRLNRLSPASGVAALSPEHLRSYALEELIAEMTVGLLANENNAPLPVIENLAAYLAGWLQTIKEDAKLLITAASKAEKAAHYIIA